MRWIVGLAIILCGALRDLRAADRAVEPIVSRMKREPVESTALAAVGYSQKFHFLEIEFQDGLIYRYENVPGGLYTALLKAESKARYYNQHIRGRFHCLRVKPPRKHAAE